MKLMLYISGMSCNHCVGHVKTALSSVQGVNTVDVDLDKGCAVIEVSREMTITELREVIDDAGYELTELSPL